MLVTAGALSAPAIAGEPTKEKLKHVWTFEAEYPQFGNETVDEKIRNWAEEAAVTLVEESKEGATTLRPDSAMDMSITYEVTRPNDAVASIIYDIYTYPHGAAHPMRVLEVHTFDLNTGNELTLEEYFGKPDEAVKILAAKVKERVKVFLGDSYPDVFENDDFSTLDDDWFAEGSAPTRDNYAILSLEPEGVRVHFQLYQVLPYVFGLVHYVVPWDELAPAGPNPSILPTPKR